MKCTLENYKNIIIKFKKSPTSHLFDEHWLCSLAFWYSALQMQTHRENKSVFTLSLIHQKKGNLLVLPTHVTFRGLYERKDPSGFWCCLPGIILHVHTAIPCSGCGRVQSSPKSSLCPLGTAGNGMGTKPHQCQVLLPCRRKFLHWKPNVNSSYLTLSFPGRARLV